MSDSSTVDTSTTSPDPSVDHDSLLSFVTRNERASLITLIVIAGLYWLWIGLFHRSVQSDPGMSILAAQGILEHGYPLLPSGFLYPRGYVHSYLLAASMGAFGLNEFSILLPSLLAGLGSLVLVYLLCREVLGSPVAGLIAVAWLLLSATEAYIATYARMYILLQFFTLLAVYAGWRGFVQGDGRHKHKWISVLAVAAGIATHELGAILPAAIVAAVVLVKYVEVRDPRQWQIGYAEASLLALIPIGVFTVYYSPPGSIQGIAAHGGMDMDRMGFALSLQGVRAQISHFERMFPFTLFLLPLAAFPAVRSFFPSKRRAKTLGFLFVLSVFMIVLGALIAMLQASAVRYVISIAPLYAALLVGSLVDLWKHRKAVPGIALVGGAALWMLGSAGAVLAANTPYVADAYGLPCDRTTDACNVIIKETYEQLQTEIAPADHIVSDVPWVTNYYLSRVDGFLRQARVGEDLEGYGVFENATDEYFGVQLIDMRAELLDALDGDARTWVIIDNQLVSRFVSEDFLHLLDEELRVHARNESLTVYVTP